MLPDTELFQIGSEIKQFVARCLGDITKQPESIQAGLSSVLLGLIIRHCPKMQQTIANDVFRRLLADMEEPTLPLAKRVAFLSVLA